MREHASVSLQTLTASLTESAGVWLNAAVLSIERSPSTIGQYFAAASRRCGRTPWGVDDPQGIIHGCLDDLARASMLAALPTRGQDLIDQVTELYRHGDANEKRGVLRALHLLDAPLGESGVGDSLVPLVHDAVRTNDLRLVAAAMQGYGADRLEQAAWRHAAVKCVFVGIPLSALVNLADRQDAEFARMLVDLAHERVAAGRAIPADIPDVVSAFPESLDRPDLPSLFLARLTADDHGTTADHEPLE